MWLDLVRQRAEDCGGISIGVRQGGGCGIRAASSRTSARPHLSDATPQGGLIVGSAAVSDPRGAGDVHGVWGCSYEGSAAEPNVYVRSPHFTHSATCVSRQERTCTCVPAEMGIAPRAVLRRSERTRFSSANNDEVGAFKARSARSERSERSNQTRLQCSRVQSPS